MNKLFGVAIALCFLATTARADVTLPKVIDNNMVLQHRQSPVSIWGKAVPGEKVTVRFAGQEKTVTADGNGQWQIKLDAMEASDQPQEMTISAANSITLHNILVGEVWFCSGQSNMEFSMHRGGGYHAPATGPDPIKADLATVHEPGIRLFYVHKILRGDDVIASGWKECQGAALNEFSALAYFFAKDLHQKLNVPIGMMEAAWGGQRIERFIAPEGYPDKLPDFHFRPREGKFSDIYQHMIHPLVPFALRGMLWYQGEANVGIDDGPSYFSKMSALIGGFRAAWHQPNTPFYYVQLAPYLYYKGKAPISAGSKMMGEIWQGQTMALSIPNTGMVATLDINENPINIHPPDKWDVGHRLATMALARVYGQTNLIDSGPLYKETHVEGSKLRIRFDHADGGLKTSDGQSPREFEIAAEDGHFVAAQADIDGNTIIVSNPQVTTPVKVRYAWSQSPRPNLTNNAGLPVFPFRSDDTSPLSR